MLFNSFTFVLFLAIVLLLHYLPFAWRLKKFNLLMASYVFYAAWNPPFVVLLWFSTVVDWFAAREMERSDTVAFRRLMLGVSLATNLGLLAFFKYGNFAVDSFAQMVNACGISYAPATMDIILPVGISFYTFQTLSYTLDVYRRKATTWGSFLDFALYVTFFPQLVAGPIVRAVDFLPQCSEPRKASASQVGWGLSLLLLGLFQKVVVADGLLAPIADAVYGTSVAPTFASAWVGTLAFSGQIFCDFSGYSTCAIGVAMCLGFSLPDNFRFPYAAVGFSDFWQRWHVSLSSWLRDYLYIPLGGNRNGNIRTYANLMFTMLIGGLWHGASWVFVVWGGLHGLYLVAEKLIRSWMVSRRLRTPAWMWPLWGLSTFALICFTWVFFRARTFEQAFSIAAAMLGHVAGDAVSIVAGVAVWEVSIAVGLLLMFQWILRNTTLEHAAAAIPWWVRSGVLALLIVSLVLMPGEERAFIYFQF
jgi:D-alanyl-lipoteichoic acid acyltransferase DltB (MBOAT superfamily)